MHRAAPDGLPRVARTCMLAVVVVAMGDGRWVMGDG